MLAAMEYLCFLFPVVIVCALLGGWFGHDKGRAGEGAILGFLFGPLGVIAALLLQEKWVWKCPFCLSRIPAHSLRCRFCCSNLTAGKGH